MADSIDTMPTTFYTGQHPRWCHSSACQIHPPGDIGPAYVMHSVVVLDHEGYVVELRQRDLLNVAADHLVHREPARVFVTHHGEEVRNVAVEHTKGLDDAISRAIALAEDGS